MADIPETYAFQRPENCWVACCCQEETYNNHLRANAAHQGRCFGKNLVCIKWWSDTWNNIIISLLVPPKKKTKANMAAYALALPFNIFAALFILFCLVFFTVPITITIDLFGYLCCLPLLAIGNSCGKNCFDFRYGKFWCWSRKNFTSNGVITQWKELPYKTDDTPCCCI